MKNKTIQFAIELACLVLVAVWLAPAVFGEDRTVAVSTEKEVAIKDLFGLSVDITLPEPVMDVAQEIPLEEVDMNYR